MLKPGVLQHIWKCDSLLRVSIQHFQYQVLDFKRNMPKVLLRELEVALADSY
jgi:hypothetical protein